jgi:hypothetical protein
LIQHHWIDGKKITACTGPAKLKKEEKTHHSKDSMCHANNYDMVCEGVQMNISLVLSSQKLEQALQ